MPYESTGDFLLNASPEELKRMDEIMKSIKPYDPLDISTNNRTYLYWSSIRLDSIKAYSTPTSGSSILNIKRRYTYPSATSTSNTLVIDSCINNTEYRNTKTNQS